jgi:hypothetical protein
MGNSGDSDDFEDEDDDELDEAVGDEQLDLDRAIKDLEATKRRAQRGGEPAWRRLEQWTEQKQTAELISDFEDYDIGDGVRPHKPGKGSRPGRVKR